MTRTCRAAIPCALQPIIGHVLFFVVFQCRSPQFEYQLRKLYKTSKKRVQWVTFGFHTPTLQALLWSVSFIFPHNLLFFCLSVHLSGRLQCSTVGIHSPWGCWWGYAHGISMGLNGEYSTPHLSAHTSTDRRLSLHQMAVNGPCLIWMSSSPQALCNLCMFYWVWMSVFLQWIHISLYFQCLHFLCLRVLRVTTVKCTHANVCFIFVYLLYIGSFMRLADACLPDCTRCPAYLTSPLHSSTWAHASDRELR